MTEKGDEAFVVNGVILPVKDMSADELGLMENAGFLRAEWDGHHWLFPSANEMRRIGYADLPDKDEDCWVRMRGFLVNKTTDAMSGYRKEEDK